MDPKVKEDLCKLCNGTCDSKGVYAGYEGAFKCMANGSNDRVGFVKQDTANAVLDYPGGKYGNSSDYELLCKNGTTASKSNIMIFAENKLSKNS